MSATLTLHLDTANASPSPASRPGSAATPRSRNGCASGFGGLDKATLADSLDDAPTSAPPN